MACGNTEVSRDGLVSAPTASHHPNLASRIHLAPVPTQALSQHDRRQVVSRAEQGIASAQAAMRIAQSPTQARAALRIAEKALADARRSGATLGQLRTAETALAQLKRDAGERSAQARAADMQQAERAASAGNRSLAAVLGKMATESDDRIPNIGSFPQQPSSAAPPIDDLSRLLQCFIEAHDPATGKMDPEGWMALVNPEFEGYVDYRGKMPHNINCGLSAQAVASALDGRPRLAGAVQHGMTPSQMKEWSGVEQRPTSIPDIESRLRQMPPGSHAIIGLDYKDGGGHWINALWDGVRVWVLDGQDGTCRAWPPVYLNVASYDAIFTEGHVMRWEN